jgi:hypothetical protein
MKNNNQFTDGYCGKIKEICKNPDASKWIELAANGDQSAHDFGWSFWCFMHVFDDLIDKDVEVSKEDAVEEFSKFFSTICYNQFFNRYKDQLFPMIISLCNRCVCGDEWENSSDQEKRKLARVVRCGDIDIFFHIAFLTGGWKLMRMLKDMRTYDKEGV